MIEEMLEREPIEKQAIQLIEEDELSDPAISLNGDFEESLS